MENIKNLKIQFDKIIKKYNLNNEQKANQITEFITNSKNKKINHLEFSQKFKMSINETKVFLEFIQKSIEFKKNIIKK